ncbi:hypothetical protein ACSHWB_36060 [Lentzea sp. HUAS TT2]|uniref:hypothetical protein n=1 Tax=Lentzea sp. HUAS TT2 TaxID=3447454 RepID=UPI003F6F4B50
MLQPGVPADERDHLAAGVRQTAWLGHQPRGAGRARCPERLDDVGTGAEALVDAALDDTRLDH